MQALLLAAGFGTRLRPYSLLRPKPLFPVCNTPLLYLLLEQLHQAGCTRVVVNAHHLAWQIQAALDTFRKREKEGGMEIHFQFEAEILGTGGSIRQAAQVLEAEPVLVMNGDIFHNINLGALYRFHKQNTAQVTMAMHDYPRFNSVAIGTAGEKTDVLIRGFSSTQSSSDKKSGAEKRLAFTGIHVVDQSVIQQIPAQGFFHSIDLYEQLATQDQVMGYRVDGPTDDEPRICGEQLMWRDMGTPEDYLDLHRELLRHDSVSHVKQMNVYWKNAQDTVVMPEVDLQGWGCIGHGSSLDGDLRVKNAVIWEGGKLKGGTWQNCIITGDPWIDRPESMEAQYRQFIEEPALHKDITSEALLPAVQQLVQGTNWEDFTDVTLTPVNPDGSMRRLFRLQERGGNRSLMALLPPPPSEDQAANLAGRAEALSFVSIGRHLFHKGLAVPQVHAFSPQTGLILCEDLGDTRLYEEISRLLATPDERDKKFCYTKQTKAKVRSLYGKVFEKLVPLQIQGSQGLQDWWCWERPLYDEQTMLERESGYFRAAFCEGLLGMKISSPDSQHLNQEFQTLARCAASAPHTFFLHRDMQSRNIMLCSYMNGHQEVRFVDFQGGRRGPLAYDLASLLIDPYVHLPLDLQKVLVSDYLACLRTHVPYDEEQFHREYLVLGMQRNLQILGAFAFLSQVRQKPFFAQFLQPALLRLWIFLQEISSDYPQAGTFPVLESLLEQAARKLEKRDNDHR